MLQTYGVRETVNHINFTNLLNFGPISVLENGVTAVDQPATRTASVHVMGMQLVGGIGSDGSNVGQNGSSLVHPGGSAAYTFYAQHGGTYLLYSTAATTGGRRRRLALGRPAHPEDAERTGTEIVHTDLNAIIAGPGGGRFPAGAYRPNPVYPDRDQPFREFTVIFHDEIMAEQAFFDFLDPVLSHTLQSVRDNFAIYYGTGGIGAEILANRNGVGPTKDCVECKYEEFFLSSWAGGDPAIIVDNPANSGIPAEWMGSQHGHGPSNHFDAVLMNGAGGAFGVPGDYLYRDQQSFMFDGGLWGDPCQAI